MTTQPVPAVTKTNGTTTTTNGSHAARPVVAKLADYNIDKVSGFLSNPPPLRRLPAYFDQWESIIDNLNQLLVAGSLRKRVLKLPELDVSRLANGHEWKRAYMVLSFIAHAYISGIPKADTIESIVPACIARPWFAVSKHLSLMPVISYAGVELFNWYLLDPQGPLDLSNIAMQHTFSGVFDEAWFYLVPLGVEAAGAPALQAFLNAQQAILDKDHDTLVKSLTTIANVTHAINDVLKRMYEKNDPHIFWNRVRPYAGGSKNSPKLPHGIFYEGVTEIDEHVNLDGPMPADRVGTWRCYAGASAGQSPLIHSLDVGLSIDHSPMPVSVPDASNGDDAPAAKKAAGPNPMLEMRAYLSAEHRDFLVALGNGPSIRDYLTTLPPNHAAVAEFDRAITGMKLFRDTHIKITTVYIILQQKKDIEGTGGNLLAPEKGAVGTGGTDLIPFLRQTRQETVDALVKKA
ncbi:Indoleamine 2,3-dioxygenase [Entophlyctis helioformis]|nr:Indoleamine 2,3-dioxygenase [Entophlyctis helioformis]